MSNSEPGRPVASWPEARNFRKSIRFEFSLYISLLILALMAVTGYVITDKFVGTVTRSVAEKLLVQARSFSGMAGKHIISSGEPDALLLNNICKKLAVDNPDIYWAGIAGTDRVFLAHTDLKQVISKAEMSEPPEGHFGEILHENERFAQRGDTIYITTPIVENGILLGRLGLASSVREITDARRASVIAVASTTLFMVLVGMIVGMVLLHRKLRPVSIITDKLRHVSVDNMTLDIPVTSKNEFGYLAETLRVMGSRLQSAQQEKIQNERISRELEIAHEIQANILPRAYPSASDFEFAGSYHSAREVGGDYYDFINFDDEQLGFLVADVSGKSLPGMLVMLLTRDIVRQVSRSIRTPGRLLSEVNSELLQNIKKGMFVTMFFGLLNKKSGRFDFASAGHNPLIRIDGLSGRTELIKTRGYPLGMMPPEPFARRIEEAHVMLNSGDWLIQYSDGVNEAQNEAADEFGMDRFIEIVSDYKDLDPPRLVSQTLDRHRDFVGSAPQYDDITLLAMKWKGLSVDINVDRNEERVHAN